MIIQKDEIHVEKYLFEIIRVYKKQKVWYVKCLKNVYRKIC